jgi:putative transcriptional regulator
MRLAALLAALAFAVPLPSREPAIGRLLIATPQVGGFFAESVIVLVDHGAHGSLGLIVNRPTGLSLAELLPELADAEGHVEHAYLGGPVATGQLLLLVRSAAPPPGAARVLDEISVSGSRDTLRALLAKKPAGSELRGYVGYAGWASGQLEGELARGDWVLAPGDAASVFTSEPGGLWKQLLQKHQAIEVRTPPQRAPAVAALAKSINLSAPWRSAAASSVSRTSAKARSSTR